MLIRSLVVQEPLVLGDEVWIVNASIVGDGSSPGFSSLSLGNLDKGCLLPYERFNNDQVAFAGISLASI